MKEIFNRLAFRYSAKERVHTRHTQASSPAQHAVSAAASTTNNLFMTGGSIISQRKDWTEVLNLTAPSGNNWLLYGAVKEIFFYKAVISVLNLMD